MEAADRGPNGSEGSAMHATGRPPLTRGTLHERARSLVPEHLALLTLMPLVAAAVASTSAPGGESKYVDWWGTSRGWETMWQTIRVAALAAVIVLNSVGLPVEGLALILGVDRPLDMLRTVVNITGDSTVSSIVARSEGELNAS